MTKSAFDEIRPDEYTVASEPAQLGLLLVNKLDDHAHLRDAKIAYLFRDEEISSGGKVELASASLSRFNGPSWKRWSRFVLWSVVRLVGFQPDFIMLLDRNIWSGLEPRQKLALVDHELTHMVQATDAEGEPRFNQTTGEPIWTIRPHDVEEFDEVVRRHGAWKDDLVTFARAVIDSLNHGPSLELPSDVRQSETG